MWLLALGREQQQPPDRRASHRQWRGHHRHTNQPPWVRARDLTGSAEFLPLGKEGLLVQKTLGLLWEWPGTPLRVE